MASKNKEKEIVGYVGYAEVVGNPTRSVKSSGSSTVGQWKWDGVPIDEKHRVAWEDKRPGDYYRYNAAEKVNEDGYRRYINVSTGNKSTGYSAKFHAEEKYAKSDSGRYLNDY